MIEEHGELRESAREVVAGFGRRADEGKVWDRLVELGWLLVAVPEELGGLGQGRAGAGVLYSELGRGVIGATYLPAMLVLDAICQSELAYRQAWIERIAGGEFVAAALAAGDVFGGHSKLNGVARAVPFADEASHILVCAPDCVALAPADCSGVELVRRPTWDETRALFDVCFTDVALSADLILASGSAANRLSDNLAAHRDLALAADSVGGAAALLDMVVEYLCTRRQFGRPLALFQALKHRCADLKAQIAAAEAMLNHALARAEGAEADAALTAKMAKQLACAVYATTAEEAVQLHGGIAMTSEHNCHLYLKRALLNQHLGAGGDSEARAVGAALLGAA